MEIERRHDAITNMTAAMSQFRGVFPQLTTVLFSLRVVEDHRGGPTAGTDGISLYYNKDFVDSLSVRQVIGLLWHEVMHVALYHHTRRLDRDPVRWNMACDYAINLMANDFGAELPPGALLNKKYTGMTAEQIYSVLPEQGEGAGCPWGRVDDLPGRDGNGKAIDVKAHEMQVRDNVNIGNEMARRSKRAGNFSGDWDRMVSELNDPVLPWRTLLRDHVTRTFKTDYDWMRPNRRIRTSYLPSMHGEGIDDAVVVIDTSGSITQNDLNDYAAEINSIFDAYECGVYVLYCDTSVSAEEKWSRADRPLSLRMTGGGGTDFRPPFRWVEDRGITPSVLIYFTDLAGRFPDSEPGFPVLWVTRESDEAPIGTTIHIN